jgi:hypothetical protein
MVFFEDFESVERRTMSNDTIIMSQIYERTIEVAYNRHTNMAVCSAFNVDDANFCLVTEKKGGR